MEECNPPQEIIAATLDSNPNTSHSNVEKEPIDFQTVKSFIRDHEVSFLNALQEYGDNANVGRQISTARGAKIDFDKFVGARLCVLSSLAVYKALRSKFGDKVGINFEEINVDLKDMTVNDIEIVSEAINPSEKNKETMNRNTNITVLNDTQMKLIQNEVNKGNNNLDPNHTVIKFKGTDGKTYFIDPTYGQINPRLNRIVIDNSINQRCYYPNLGIIPDDTLDKYAETEESLKAYIEDIHQRFPSFSIELFYKLIEAFED